MPVRLVIDAEAAADSREIRRRAAYFSSLLDPSELARRAAVRVTFVVVPALLLWVLGVRAALEALRRQDVPKGGMARRTFLVGWLGASAFAVTAGGRFFGHYFHQMTAPLAILAAPGAADIWRARRRMFLAALGFPAAVFFLLALFHQRVMAAAGEPDPDYHQIASFVQRRSAPRDDLVIWGNSPVLYFEAERPLGSRFVFSNYLTGLSPATRTQSDPAADASRNVVPESWDMFEADLAARRPRLFIDTSPGNIAGYGKFPPRRFPRLQSILERDYGAIGEVGGARVFERRAFGKAPGAQ